VVSDVTVTDPRHPLFGQRLKLLPLICGRGPAFVAVALADGRRRLLRRAETDLERPLAPEAALPRISARALLPLAQHIRSMLAVSRQEAPHAELPASSSPRPTSFDEPSTISPAPMACAADSHANPVGAATGLGAPARPGQGGGSC
jgi:hypothetical protein